MKIENYLTIDEFLKSFPSEKDTSQKHRLNWNAEIEEFTGITTETKESKSIYKDPEIFKKEKIYLKLRIKSSFLIKIEQTRKRENNFAYGDISNQFFSVFKINFDNSEINVSYNEDNLRRFISDFRFPCIYSNPNNDEPKLNHYVIYSNGELIEYNHSTTSIVNREILYPLEKDFEIYISSLIDLYKTLVITAFIYPTFYTKNTLLYDFKMKRWSQIINFETLNDLLLYDFSQSLSKHHLITCKSCGSKFIQNRKQTYCANCKPKSRMTKKEFIEKGQMSEKEKIRFDRNALIKKLNRKIDKLEKKNQKKDPERRRFTINNRLIKEGFEPIREKRSIK